MIAIKGMEIPERCAKCKFCVNQKINDYGYFGECLLKENKKVNCLVWSRDDNCSLLNIRDDTQLQILRENVADMKVVKNDSN